MKKKLHSENIDLIAKWVQTGVVDLEEIPIGRRGTVESRVNALNNPEPPPQPEPPAKKEVKRYARKKS